MQRLAGVLPGDEMKLGLIGTGKQGQRYLMEKNGGRHIALTSSSRLEGSERDHIWPQVDGVIVACHPAGHKSWCLDAIAHGKAVLCEKPLALNLKDCEEIIDAAKAAKVPFLVAHLDCWASPWLRGDNPGAYCVVTYPEHTRDYSVWLDWAPHALALLAKVGACDARNVLMQAHEPGHTFGLQMIGAMGRLIYERRPAVGVGATPMALAVRSLTLGEADYETNRRIYQALFAEE